MAQQNPPSSERDPVAQRASRIEVRIVFHAALVRAAFYFCVWIVLIGLKPADLLAGVPVAALATWASLHLLPARPRRFNLFALMSLALRFLAQSVVAGFDVARRAFDPRLPLHPGFVNYPVRSPPGMFRNAFAAFTSLQPGTVPAGSDENGIVYHCLDLGEPVVTQLTAEEAALSRVLQDD